jgi:hypothetical protein
LATELEGSTLQFSKPIADAVKPKPLPAGDYRGTIREVKKMLSQKNTKYVNVVFFIPSSQYPADYTDGNEDGTILNYGRISGEDTPRGRWSVKAFFEGIGLPAPGTRVELNDLMNQDATLHVAHEMYEGEPQARIAKVSKAA